MLSAAADHGPNRGDNALRRTCLRGFAARCACALRREPRRRKGRRPRERQRIQGRSRTPDAARARGGRGRHRAPAPPARLSLAAVSRRAWFLAALAVAAAQLALAVRCGAVTFYGPLALGWGAMLLVARERGESPLSAGIGIPGAVLALVPFAWLARPEYGPLDRSASLVSGLGLLL